MNKYTGLLNCITNMKRNYSSDSQNIKRQIARQKFEEILKDINKSKHNITNISCVEWNTEYQSGNTLLFNFTNESNSYEGQIFIRNIKNDTFDETVKSFDKDYINDNDYLNDKSVEFAKKN
jgi:hypothetical protein